MCCIERRRGVMICVWERARGLVAIVVALELAELAVFSFAHVQAAVVPVGRPTANHVAQEH